MSVWSAVGPEAVSAYQSVNTLSSDRRGEERHTEVTKTLMTSTTFLSLLILPTRAINASSFLVFPTNPSSEIWNVRGSVEYLVWEAERKAWWM